MLKNGKYILVLLLLISKILETISICEVTNFFKRIDNDIIKNNSYDILVLIGFKNTEISLGLNSDSQLNRVLAKNNTQLETIEINCNLNISNIQMDNSLVKAVLLENYEHSSYLYFKFMILDLPFNKKVHINLDNKFEFNTTDYYPSSNSNKDFNGNKNFKILTFGDIGYSYFGNTTLRFLDHLTKNKNYEMTLFLGDIVYNMEDNNGTYGNSFLNEFFPYFSDQNFIATIGNHDSTNYFKEFKSRLPTKLNSTCNLNDEISLIIGNEQYFKKWKEIFYSFYYYKDLLILNLNSLIIEEKYFSKEILNFVKSKLNEELNEILSKNNFLYKIAMTHFNVYCSYDKKHCRSQAESMRNNFEETIFIHFDLILSGHLHSYERLSPIYKNKLDNSYPLYIVCGSGGNKDTMLSNSMINSSLSFNSHIFSHHESSGICELEFNENEITINFISSISNTVLDSIKRSLRKNTTVINNNTQSQIDSEMDDSINNLTVEEKENLDLKNIVNFVLISVFIFELVWIFYNNTKTYFINSFRMSGINNVNYNTNASSKEMEYMDLSESAD